MKFLLLALFLIITCLGIHAKYNKIKTNLSKNYFNIVDDKKVLKTPPQIGMKITYKSPQHFKIFKLILGTILLFTLISIYKLYEEIYQLKKSHLATKYCNVIQFDQEKMSVQDVQEKLTFVSGKVNILEAANDEMVKFKNEHNFIRIKREVCVYNYIKQKWELIKDQLSQDEQLFNEVDYINFEQKDNILKISYEDKNYIFPNITTRNLNGNV